jgi:hypothetical protein
MNGYVNLFFCKSYHFTPGPVVIPRFIQVSRYQSLLLSISLDYPDKPGNDVARQNDLLGPYTDICTVHCSREYMMTASINLHKNLILKFRMEDFSLC